MTLTRLAREYPNVNGFPVSPGELELPPTMLNPERQDSYNNHHLCWTARRMGEFVITQTWRDLAKNQAILPKDIHAVLHDRYEPPKHLPDLTDLMDEIDACYQSQSLLRYGSAANPTYNVISEAKYRLIQQEYNGLHA